MAISLVVLVELGKSLSSPKPIADREWTGSRKARVRNETKEEKRRAKAGGRKIVVARSGVAF